MPTFGARRNQRIMMSEINFMEVGTTTAFAIISALIGGYFSARLALRGAVSEKLWDRREKAYTEVLESLHQLKLYYEVNAGWSVQRNLSPEELKDRRMQALAELERCKSVHAWIFNDGAVHALSKLLNREGRDLSGLESQFDYFEAGGSVDDALNLIEECAVHDLHPPEGISAFLKKTLSRLNPMNWEPRDRID